jgi:hypothetical protein
MERKEAIELGLARYNTGRPCKHGHTGGRSTLNGACIECNRTAVNEYNRRARQNAITAHLPGLRDLAPVIGLRVHPSGMEALRAYADTLNAHFGIPTADGGTRLVTESHVPAPE